MQINEFVFDLPLYIVAGKQMPMIADEKGHHIPIYTEQLLAEREMGKLGVALIASLDHLDKFVTICEKQTRAVGVCFDPVKSGDQVKGKFAVSWALMRRAIEDEQGKGQKDS